LHQAILTLRAFAVAAPIAITAGCTAHAPADSLSERIQSSPNREALQAASANVGRTFWLKEDSFLSFSVCSQPVYIEAADNILTELARPSCTSVRNRLTVLDVTDGKVSASSSTGRITVQDAVFYQVSLENGQKGYVKASDLEERGTTVDPAISAAKAAADCKRRGDPRIGMTVEHVIATCWGKPESVNRTQVGAHVHDQFVYSSRGAYLYFDDGVLTSAQTTGPLR
jgi:hypothetical protein